MTDPMDDFADFVADLPDDAEIKPVPVPKNHIDLIGARRLLRALLGDAALVSVTEAAEWLPLGDRRGRRWLRKAGLVRTIDGKDVVRWGDVLQAVDGRPAVSVQTKHRPCQIDGVKLDEVEEWLAS